MAKSVHYNNSIIWQQFLLGEDDYTMGGGYNLIANRFLCVKDSNDNIYVICLYSGLIYGDELVPVIKFDKNGNKTVIKITNLEGYKSNYDDKSNLLLSRDETLLFCCFDWTNPGSIYTIPTNMLSTTATSLSIGSQSVFRIYKDRYMWIAANGNVSIYDYTSKVQISTKSIVVSGNNMTYPIASVLDSNNNLYLIGHFNGFKRIAKVTFTGISTLTESLVADLDPDTDIYKQILIDKWGDLIIFTNSGVTSKLLKYSTSGDKIGSDLDLSGLYYNFNTDKNGNYFYSDSANTYKITANTTHGQEFTGAGVSILESGMITYNNNMTGYSPAVFS